jgi:spermidine synthase
LRSNSGRAGVLLALYAASGCGALVLETVWLRWFRLLFGATAPAAAATLVAFFAGQALGAWLGSHRIPRVRRPLGAYGLLELAAAASALATPLWLRAAEVLTAEAYDALLGSPALLAGLRLAIALVATLPASLCMGAAFPAIGAAAMARSTELGARGGALYAANLGGATLGAALAGFFLPPALGVDGTYASGIGLLAGVGCVALARGRSEHPRSLPAPAGVRSGASVGRRDRDNVRTSALPGSRSRGARDRAARPHPGPHRLLGLAAFSGFAALGAQVLLVEAFGLVLNQSVHAFAAVLVWILLGLALGASLVALSERRGAAAPEQWVAWGLVVTAFGLTVFPALLANATDGLQILTGAGAGYAARSLGLVAATAGLPVLGAGVVLPGLLALAGRGESVGTQAPERQLGRLLAANTLGALVGALFVPFVLLELFSPWAAFLVLGLGTLVASLFVRLPDRRTRLARDLVLAVGWVVALTAASPLEVPPVRVGAGEKLAFLRTGTAGTVAVLERNGELLIRTDNHYNLGGTADRRHQERQGHLARLLHPDARRVAWIGSATGISAGVLTLGPLDSLTLVEIVPDVVEAARLFADANHGVHADPRVRVVLDDARNFMRTTREHFDLVVADLFVPWRAGAGSLYAREHFAAVREHLGDDGVFVQWLALYQLDEAMLQTILATFVERFPRAALVRGDFFGSHPIAALVGYAGEVPSAEATSRAAVRLRAAGVEDRWVTDPVGVWALYVGPLSPLAPRLAAAPINRDGDPRIEFMAARAYTGVAGGVADPMTGFRWLAFLEGLTAATSRRGDDIHPQLPEAARRASRAGNLLQAAGVAWVAGRAADAARYLEAAREALPPHLLEPNDPDPTAAEVWPDR